MADVIDMRTDSFDKPPHLQSQAEAARRGPGDFFVIVRKARKAFGLVLRWDATEWGVSRSGGPVMLRCGFGFFRFGALRSLYRQRRDTEMVEWMEKN